MNQLHALLNRKQSTCMPYRLPTQKLANAFTWLLFTLLLSACSDKPSDTYNEYQQRLASTTDVKFLPATQLHNLNIEYTEHKTAKQTISLVQLAQLNHCPLNGLIAGHNNQLGKVATPSSELIYQIRFIQLAKACITTIKNKPKILNALQNATADKKAQLHTSFTKLLYREPELKNTWLLSNFELDNHLSGLVETEQALQQLVNIKVAITTNDYQRIDTEQIFPALEVLNKFNFNQALISSIRKQINLNNDTRIYLESLQLEDFCAANKNKQKATILSNIFKKYYLSQLQPYQAQLTGALERLMPLYKTLWLTPSQNAPLALQPLLSDSPDNLLYSLKSSAKAHVKWWQVFYKTCEISPI